MTPNDRADIETLYFMLLERWNAQDATGMAALFVPEGHMVGFDGTEVDGSDAIERSLAAIFQHHKTPGFVAKVRSVRMLPAAAILRGIAGMVPPGQSDLNPELNAIQALVASNTTGVWRVELFQNTPAAFHGRSEARDRLTTELRSLLTKP